MPGRPMRSEPPQHRATPQVRRQSPLRGEASARKLTQHGHIRTVGHAGSERWSDPMSNYPLIADHGLIGNLQTAALVAPTGPSTGSARPVSTRPASSAALLDHDRGGHLRTRPTVDVFTQQQLYYPDTAILVTRFLTEAGVGEVVDFMPVANAAVASDQHRLVRMIRCVRGEMTFAVDIAPRFDYGREPHETHVSEDGVVFQGARNAMSAEHRSGAGRRSAARVQRVVEESARSSSP